LRAHAFRSYTHSTVICSWRWSRRLQAVETVCDLPSIR